MVSIEDLADILNDEVTEEFMDAVIELWDDDESPFDPEHPAIQPVLEKIADAINEEIEYENGDGDYNEWNAKSSDFN